MSSIGRYEVVERLGSGGFATVYRVHDPVLDSQVAAKVLADNWSGSSEIRDRFIREAQLLRRIDSHRVVTVHDIGDLPTGQPYFVMSLANRGTLEGRLKQLTSAPSREEVNALAHQLAECLHAVHDHDLIHRDIKPSNLLIAGSRSGPGPDRSVGVLAPNERLVLGDFGLAKDITLHAGGVTIAAGTGGYAAPEQMSPSGGPDRQTDLYAATAVMYRVVTNMAPPAFDYRRKSVPFPDSEWWMAGLLGEFFRRGMTVDQIDRHESVEEWLAAFVAAYGGGAYRGVSGSSTTGTDPSFDPHSAPTDVIGVSTPPLAPESPPVDPPHLGSRPLVQPPLAEPQDGFRQPPPGFEDHGVRSPADGALPATVVEPVSRSPRWPLLLLTIFILAMLGTGGYLLAAGGEEPTIVGPVEVVAGEPQRYTATFEGADGFRWTDWDGRVSEGDVFELTGIVPGTIRFEVAAMIGSRTSSTSTHEVLITPAPDAPVITGPAEITVGVEEVFGFESADGTDPEWTDSNGSQPGQVYRLTGTRPGPFEITVVVTRPDGVTRVGSRRVVQIVE